MNNMVNASWASVEGGVVTNDGLMLLPHVQMWILLSTKHVIRYICKLMVCF